MEYNAKVVEEQKAARLAKEQDTQVQARKVEATHCALADIPLESNQEWASDEDLAQQ